MSDNKRVVKRAVSTRRRPSAAAYVMEPVERRVMLSVTLSAAVQAAIDSIPAGLQMQPYLRLSPALSANDGEAGPGSNSISVAEMRGAYGITGSGAGQTVAIVDVYDWQTSFQDLNTFDAAYGLPAPPSFVKVNQFGSAITGTVPGDGGNPAAAKELSGETALDVEWLHAVAPAANIVLVEVNSATDNDLFTGLATAAAYPGVSAVSLSFGGAEFPQEVQADPVFTTPANHQGVTFVVSAGDNGAYAKDVSPATIAPNYPAASPNVVAVGGTNLTVLPGNQYGGETGWGNGTDSYMSNDPATGAVLGGGGGGISAYEPAPAYQQFVDRGLGGGMRVYPDVAMQGGPDRGVSIVDSYLTGSAQTPWLSGVAGTSLSAPLFAGVVTNANAVRTANGLSTLNGVSQTLPHLYELPLNAFHDITMGNNGYPATAGFDLITGRGSPVGPVLIADLASTYVGAHVFVDTNIDGVLQVGEPGLANVGVSLTTAAGTVVGTTTTDSGGFYQFLNLVPGTTYTVHFTPPPGFQVSPVGISPDPFLNSTADPATGNVTFTTPTVANDAAGVDSYQYANCGMYAETVTITNATLARPQAGTAAMTFTVTINPVAATRTFTIPFTTVDGVAGDNTALTGPATVAHNDYVATAGTLVFAPGTVTETISVPIVGNMLIEKDLIFRVVLSPPPAEFDLADSKTVGKGTIVNTSFPAVVTATTAGDTVTKSSTDNQTILFPVTLTATAPFPVTVSYTTVENTALAGIDFVATSGTLTFTPDASGFITALTQEVPVTILPGTTRQLDKTFFFQVGAVTRVTVGTPSQATGTILTNFPPAVSAVGGSVTESLTGTALLPFQITVAPSLSGPVTITYATADGTAVAGVDYAATSGTVTLAPGRVAQTVYVPVYRQFLEAGDKTLSFTIANPAAQLEVINPTVTGTIHYLPVTTLAIVGAQRAVYTDNLGQRVSVGIAGPGSGRLIFLGNTASATNAYTLDLSGTTAATNVTVTASGTGQTTVQAVTVEGSLNTLSAKGLNVTGAVTIAGTVNTLNLGYLSGSTVTLGGSASSRPVGINLKRAVDTSITSGAPIRTLVAGAYVDTTPAVPDYITAPSVGTVRVSGNFGGTIRTTGAVAAMIVRGSLTGGVQAAGGIGSVVAGSLADAVLSVGSNAGDNALASTAFAGTAGIGRVQVRSAFSNSVIAAYSVGRVTFGSVQNATPAAAAFGIVSTHIGAVHTALATGSSVSLANPTVSSSFDHFEVNLV